MQAIHPETHTSYKKKTIYNLFAAYLQTVPLEELIKGVERARLNAQLRNVVIYGAACSYCPEEGRTLEGSYSVFPIVTPEILVGQMRSKRQIVRKVPIASSVVTSTPNG